jgi:plastocyanin
MSGRMIRRAGAIALIAVAALVGAVAATGGAAVSAKKTKNVKVGDPTYFAPVSIKIKKGDRVKWVWQDDVVQPHNVYVTKAPKGVKKGKFRSDDSATPGFKFAKKFEKKGGYHFICTYHAGPMEMDVKVVK